MNKEMLDIFGEKLMREVRDVSISEWDKILSGDLRAPLAMQIKERCSVFSDEEMKVLKWLLPQVVDTALHYFLYMIEGSPNIELNVNLEKASYGLKDISDGLSGELYTEDGWILRFSKERVE